MKYNKMLIYIVVILVTIPICVTISGIIDMYLSNRILEINNVKDIILNIIKSPNHIKIYIMLQLLVALFFYVVTFIQNKTIFQSETVKITNNLKTPKVMGQGQYGTARWLTKKEFENNFKCNIIQKDSKQLVEYKTGGLVVGHAKNKKQEKIYYIDENLHSLIVGATRSGKTRSIVLQTVGNLGLAGESMILLDPKGEIFEYTSEFLKNKGYKVIVLDFKNPTKSSRYNFLQPVIDAVNSKDYIKAEQSVWDITTSLVGNEDSKMEKIWRDGEMSVIAGAIMTVVYENINNPEYQNLTNVYTFISEMCRTTGTTMPINKYIENLPPNHPAIPIFNIARIAPEKTRNSFFTSALTTLRLFTSKSIYGMTCESEFNLSDLGNEKVVIYIILPDEKTTYYSLASLFIYQNYVSLVEEADKRGGELKNRANYILDEFGNCPTIPAFSNMLTVAGGRKIRFNLFLQSFAQLENKYGKEVAENIRDNCQNLIYLKTASNETANVISKKLGNYTTSSYSRSNSYNKYQNGNNSESMNLISRPLLTEDEILRIERPHAIVIQTGIFPVITKLPDISNWSFNKEFGMGDIEHNRKLRLDREEQREKRDINEIELWGIWKKYK